MKSNVELKKTESGWTQVFVDGVLVGSLKRNTTYNTRNTPSSGLWSVKNRDGVTLSKNVRTRKLCLSYLVK